MCSIYQDFDGRILICRAPRERQSREAIKNATPNNALQWASKDGLWNMNKKFCFIYQYLVNHVIPYDWYKTKGLTVSLFKAILHILSLCLGKWCVLVKDLISAVIHGWTELNVTMYCCWVSIAPFHSSHTCTYYLHVVLIKEALIVRWQNGVFWLVAGDNDSVTYEIQTMIIRTAGGNWVGAILYWKFFLSS